MLVTKHVIDYKSAPYGHITIIPAGTPVVSASNLPAKGLYWAEPWNGMNEQEQSWQRNYGFLVNAEDVCEIDDGPIECRLEEESEKFKAYP